MIKIDDDTEIIKDNTKKKNLIKLNHVKESRIKPEHEQLYNNDIEEIKPDNIISEVINNLDKDVVQEENLTSIDFNTDLTNDDIASLVPLQMLTTFKLAGKNASLLARTIKRHKVSLNRKGRIEKVDIIKGEREHENEKAGSSMMGKIRGFLGGDKE